MMKVSELFEVIEDTIHLYEETHKRVPTQIRVHPKLLRRLIHEEHNQIFDLNHTNVYYYLHHLIELVPDTEEDFISIQ